MIRRFRAINNVGKFVKFIDSPDLELGKLNIIYAENGRGKTTLSHILRSLSTGDINYITERVTAGVTDASAITIDLDSGTADFSAQCWNIKYPRIEIFDTTFVNQNVCSGYYVDIDHKRQLYRFVIGEEGVKLSNDIDRLDNDIKQNNADRKTWASEIGNLVVGGMPVDEFVALALIEDIDKQILNKELEIVALKDSKEIAERPVLQQIPFSSFPEETLKNKLSTRLNDVSEDAARRVREHMERCMGIAGENWLREGMNYVSDNLCPYCGQPVNLSELVNTYQAYFSEAYDSLKSEAADFIRYIETVFSETESRKVSDAVHNNQTLAEFWSDYVPIEYPKINLSEVQDVWDRLISEVKNSLLRKNAAPLEVIPFGTELTEAIEAYNIINADIRVYNESVDLVNEELDRKKGEIATRNLMDAEQELGSVDI